MKEEEIIRLTNMINGLLEITELLSKRIDVLNERIKQLEQK
jgi:hypothetical protein